MTCKDCIHYDICKQREDKGKEIIADLGLPISEHETDDEGVELCCFAFKDKSKYIELPCQVGDTVYTVFENRTIECKVYAIRIDTLSKNNKRICVEETAPKSYWSRYMATFKFSSIGKTVFLSREEARKTLEKRLKP